MMRLEMQRYISEDVETLTNNEAMASCDEEEDAAATISNFSGPTKAKAQETSNFTPNSN
jgi:hypothetical protein